MELTHKTHTTRFPELGTEPLPIKPCVDPDVFNAEREAVFRRSWLNVGRVELIPEPGEYFVRDIEVCYTSVLVVRGHDNVIRAFHNMCSHRANQVVWQKRGKCRASFVCPFHGWAFNTRGKLVNMTDKENFFTDADTNLDLTEIQTDVWNGFIFIRIKPQDDQSLQEYLEPVATSLKDYPFAELTRREWYSVDEKSQLEGAAGRGNWKAGTCPSCTRTAWPGLRPRRACYCATVYWKSWARTAWWVRNHPRYLIPRRWDR